MPDEPNAPAPAPASSPTPTPAPAPGAPKTEQEIRQWNMYCHLSCLAGLIGIPAGNVLGPLLVWQLKKAEIPSVEVHGKAAVNFQLTILIGAAVLGILAFALSFFCIGFLLIPFIFVVLIAGVVFGVIAGLKANEGKDYKYPYSLNLIK